MASDTVLGPLQTERLALRPQRVDDAMVFRRLWTERDRRVPRHRQLVGDRPSVDDIAATIAEADPHATGPRLLTVVRRDDGAVLGYCGLNPHDGGGPDEPELAFELLRDVHGLGYATEAGRAVVGWAREAACPRLLAGVWSWNTASRRVLAKLGFREVGRTQPTSPYGVTVRTALDLQLEDVRRPGDASGTPADGPGTCPRRGAGTMAT